MPIYDLKPPNRIQNSPLFLIRLRAEKREGPGVSQKTTRRIFRPPG